MTPSPPATAPLAEGEVADGRVLHTDRPPVSPEADQPWLRPALLAVVIAAHGLAAAWLIAPPQPDGVMPPQAPPIMVSLLPAEGPAAPAPALPSVPPVPLPLKSRHPIAAVVPPRPAPSPAPAPVAAPPVASAPTAISEPAVPSPPAAAAAPSPAPSAGAGEAAPPLSPPRFDAAYLHNQTPYPPLARRMRESGTVRLRVLVSAEGLAEKIELLSSSGSPRLDEGAQEAVRRWRFIPARQGDQPVPSHVVVPIIYKLEES